MATDLKSSDTVERLNALADSELPPAEHAALAVRIAASRDLAQAYATLARLKACIAESADQTPVHGISVTGARLRRWPHFAAAAAVVACVAISALAWTFDPQPARAPLSEVASFVTLAALPAAPVIPDLTAAGLNLVGGEIEQAGETSVLVAAYRGQRGCRLELRVRPAAANVAPTVGSSRRVWTIGDLAYELVAFGMPMSRFAVVAMAAETATRAGEMPNGADSRLREASLKALPCTG